MYPLEDDGSQLMPDMDDMSTVSETSTTMTHRTVGGSAYRKLGEKLIIASRRVDEPRIHADSIGDYIIKFTICRLYFLHADDDKLIEIFGGIAVSASKCCNRTCYRNWHERKIKDKTRFLEPGPCPFQPPGSARELRPQSSSRSSGQESS